MMNSSGTYCGGFRPLRAGDGGACRPASPSSVMVSSAGEGISPSASSGTPSRSPVGAEPCSSDACGERAGRRPRASSTSSYVYVV